MMYPPGKCTLIFEGCVEGEFDTQEEATAAGEELVRLNEPLIDAVEIVQLIPEAGGRTHRLRPWLADDRVIRNEHTRPKRAANNRGAAFCWLLLIVLGLVLYFF